MRTQIGWFMFDISLSKLHWVSKQFTGYYKVALVEALYWNFDFLERLLYPSVIYKIIDECPCFFNINDKGIYSVEIRNYSSLYQSYKY